MCINRLFPYCKGGNFNIHIWAWFGYFICWFLVECRNDISKLVLVLNPNKNNSLYEILLISSYKEGGYAKLSKHICFWGKYFYLLKITNYFTTLAIFIDLNSTSQKKKKRNIVLKL